MRYFNKLKKFDEEQVINLNEGGKINSVSYAFGPIPILYTPIGEIVA